jgi:hypothetical protein
MPTTGAFMQVAFDERVLARVAQAWRWRWRGFFHRFQTFFVTGEEKPQRVLVAGGTSFSPVLRTSGFQAKFPVAGSDGQIG